MSWDTPPYENQEERLCRLCNGEDDCCWDCGGTGVETVSRGEADFDRAQQKYDDYYDRDSRG